MLARFLLLVLIMTTTPAAAAPLDWSALPLPKIEGGAFTPDAFAGKVVLVVNTASECGYTPQYEGLEALHRKYGPRGLVVLGFPMNDFGGQEPGSNKEISTFCVNQYAVDFPMFAKSALRANPLYVELARATGQTPRWNFHKYLVDRSGRRVQSFATQVEPNDPKLITTIERLLANPEEPR
jgi:glutathione peroxidase